MAGTAQTLNGRGPFGKATKCRGPEAARTDSFLQLSDQLLDPRADLIADGSNHLDALAGRVVEDPVLVALPG